MMKISDFLIPFALLSMPFIESSSAALCPTKVRHKMATKIREIAQLLNQPIPIWKFHPPRQIGFGPPYVEFENQPLDNPCGGKVGLYLNASLDPPVHLVHYCPFGQRTIANNILPFGLTVRDFPNTNMRCITTMRPVRVTMTKCTENHVLTEPKIIQLPSSCRLVGGKESRLGDFQDPNVETPTMEVID